MLAVLFLEGINPNLNKFPIDPTSDGEGQDEGD